MKRISLVLMKLSVWLWFLYCCKPQSLLKYPKIVPWKDFNQLSVKKMWKYVTISLSLWHLIQIAIPCVLGMPPSV